MFPFVLLTCWVRKTSFLPSFLENWNHKNSSIKYWISFFSTLLACIFSLLLCSLLSPLLYFVKLFCDALRLIGNQKNMLRQCCEDFENCICFRHFMNKSMNLCNILCNLKYTNKTTVKIKLYTKKNIIYNFVPYQCKYETNLKVNFNFLFMKNQIYIFQVFQGWNFQIDLCTRNEKETK